MENKPADSEKRRNSRILFLSIAVGVLTLAAVAWAVSRRPPTTEDNPGQLAHQDIKTTVFWVGETANASNGYIHNRSSTWTQDWVKAYGGVDNPRDRCGLAPCGFTPKENPFYFALPYNDLTDDCSPKPSQAAVPWFEQPPDRGDSVVKNQWIKIQYLGKVAYAQWEDAGPFGEDDTAYVFGQDKPAASAGLDISPATADYLGVDGEAQTSWEFVDSKSVPEGPWLKTVTATSPDCTS